MNTLEFLRTYEELKSYNPGATVYGINGAMKELKRLDTKIHHLCEMYCNGDLDENGFDTSTKTPYKKLDKLAKDLNIVISVNQDPRGPAVCLHLPSGHYNSWDGETWRLLW
jgi:hypothetical protein